METTEQTEILGYDIERAEPGETFWHDEVGYILTGKRGAQYRLCRDRKYTHLMHVRNEAGNIVGLKGNYTFSDKSGHLAVQYR